MGRWPRECNNCGRGTEPIGMERLMNLTTRLGRLSRRGVASVLAMMFVVLFGSLAVAMAVVSKGNLRTAQTHLHVMRAMGAADTGLAVAESRLADAVSRFVVSRGTVDSAFGWKLWSGTLGSSDGTVRVLPPKSGFSESVTPAGVSQALINAYAADLNHVHIPGISDTPTSHAAPAGTDASVYKLSGWVTAPAVAIDANAAETGANPAAFQVTYAPLANGFDVRIIITGYSSVGTLGGSGYHYGGYNHTTGTLRPLTRAIQQDYHIAKRHEHAMVSPSRIMIGKNVHVNGDIGARYTDVAQNNGHPITIRSDFFGLDPILDAKLSAFFTALQTFDVDGDNRLRVNHPTEGQGIPSNATDYNHDGQPDNAFRDATGDGFVDEFDIFLNHFDRDGDGRVVLSSALTAGTPAEGRTPEFTLDEDLALLIDSQNPDRNRNGVSGFVDSNHNGRWDNGEQLNDYDAVHQTFPDRDLGYRDGFIDRKDQYTKVRGRLVFASSRGSWEGAHGAYQQYVRGPIIPPTGQSATRFSAPAEDLPVVDQSSFTNDQTPLQNAADGASFDQQVATQLGIAVNQLATYTEASTDATHRRYFRSNMSDATVFTMTGRHLYEKMPFTSPSYADWYYRARYENMVFKNVQVPQGNNGLFINCTFVGVTYARSYAANTHSNWSLYGKLVWNDAAGRPIADPSALDRSDFNCYTPPGPNPCPSNYSSFPDPPVINGVTVLGAARDTKRYSNNIRFHDCLFVGSIIGDTPTAYTHIRNKFQFTGGTRFTTVHPTQPSNPDLNPDSDDLPEIAKTSMMLPNSSVDIGQFNSPTDTFVGGPTPQNVQLHGTIIAGVLDVRGNTKIDGTLLLTFAPVAGQGPLRDPQGNPIGNPANFNATLGYFGPADGDSEALDPATLPIVNGRRIVGWDRDGDGIADVAPDQAQPAGSVAVPFYGYGRIELNWNPDLPMPDGVLLPVSVTPMVMTYREGVQ